MTIIPNPLLPKDVTTDIYQYILSEAYHNWKTDPTSRIINIEYQGVLESISCEIQVCNKRIFNTSVVDRLYLELLFIIRQKYKLNDKLITADLYFKEFGKFVTQKKNLFMEDRPRNIINSIQTVFKSYFKDLSNSNSKTYVISLKLPKMLPFLLKPKENTIEEKIDEVPNRDQLYSDNEDYFSDSDSDSVEIITSLPSSDKQTNCFTILDKSQTMGKTKPKNSEKDSPTKAYSESSNYPIVSRKGSFIEILEAHENLDGFTKVIYGKGRKGGNNAPIKGGKKEFVTPQSSIVNGSKTTRRNFDSISKPITIDREEVKKTPTICEIDTKKDNTKVSLLKLKSYEFISVARLKNEKQVSSAPVDSKSRKTLITKADHIETLSFSRPFTSKASVSKVKTKTADSIDPIKHPQSFNEPKILIELKTSLYESNISLSNFFLQNNDHGAENKTENVNIIEQNSSSKIQIIEPQFSKQSQLFLPMEVPMGTNIPPLYTGQPLPYHNFTIYPYMPLQTLPFYPQNFRNTHYQTPPEVVDSHRKSKDNFLKNNLQNLTPYNELNHGNVEINEFYCRDFHHPCSLEVESDDSSLLYDTNNERRLYLEFEQSPTVEQGQQEPVEIARITTNDEIPKLEENQPVKLAGTGLIKSLNCALKMDNHKIEDLALLVRSFYPKMRSLPGSPILKDFSDENRRSRLQISENKPIGEPFNYQYDYDQEYNKIDSELNVAALRKLIILLQEWETNYKEEDVELLITNPEEFWEFWEHTFKQCLSYHMTRELKKQIVNLMKGFRFFGKYIKKSHEISCFSDFFVKEILKKNINFAVHLIFDRSIIIPAIFNFHYRRLNVFNCHSKIQMDSYNLENYENQPLNESIQELWFEWLYGFYYQIPLRNIEYNKFMIFLRITSQTKYKPACPLRFRIVKLIAYLMYQCGLPPQISIDFLDSIIILNNRSSEWLIHNIDSVSEYIFYKKIDDLQLPFEQIFKLDIYNLTERDLNIGGYLPMKENTKYITGTKRERKLYKMTNDFYF